MKNVYRLALILGFAASLTACFQDAQVTSTGGSFGSSVTFDGSNTSSHSYTINSAAENFSVTGSCSLLATSIEASGDAGVTWSVLSAGSGSNVDCTNTDASPGGDFSIDFIGGVVSGTAIGTPIVSYGDSSQIQIRTVGPLGPSSAGTLTINYQAPAEIQFASATASVAENVASGRVVLSLGLSAAVSSDVTIDYSMAAGTASVGSDFTALSGTATVPAGSTAYSLTLQAILDDTAYESNENLTVTLANPLPAAKVILGASNVATVTITENESQPIISFQAATQNSNENVGSSNIIVQLSSLSSQLITVNYAVTGGTALGSGNDYTFSDGVLTFSAGDLSKTLSLNINNDAIYEPTETVIIELTSPTNATINAAFDVHTHSIIEDQSAPTIEFASATGSTNENIASPFLANIDINLSHASASAIVLNYTVAGVTAAGGGTDYTFVSGAVTIPASSTSYSLAPLIIDDALAEGDESFTVTLTGTGGGASLASTTLHTHTITDNESAPTVSFAAPTASVAESVGTQNVVLNMTGASASSVVVALVNTGTAVSGAGNDYTLSASSVTFAAGVVSKTISVTINDDGIGEAAETVILDIDSVTGGGVLEGVQGTHTLTINLSDTPTLQYAATTSSVTEANVIKDVVIQLSNAADAAVTVQYNILGTSTVSVSDYTYSSGVATFAAGELSKTLAVQILNDAVYETPDEFIDLDLTGLSANATYGTNTAHKLTINDGNGKPNVNIASATYLVGEEAGQVVLSIQLSHAANVATSVSYATSNGGGSNGAASSGAGNDYTSTSGVMNFAALATAGSITVPILSDLAIEGDEDFSVTLSAPSADINLGTITLSVVTIDDNDSSAPALLTISEADPYDFGSQATGSSINYTFTLTNSGGLTATGLTGSGLAAPFSYPAGGTCVSTLAAGASCTFVVNFAPTGTGVHADTVSVDYNDGVAAQSATRDVTGTGVAPASLAISDGPTYDFGSKPTGSSTNYTFTITNSGGVTATGLTGSGLAAPFSYPAGGTCVSTLAAGASCTFVVNYAPTGTGVHADTVSIDYNDGVAAQSATRDVTGTGIAPPVLSWAATPNSVLENVASGTIVLTVDLSYSVSSEVVVNYASSNGGGANPATATGGTTTLGTDDYTPTSGTLTLAAFATSGTVTIPITDDTIFEGDENFTMTLSSPVNATIASAAKVVTITEDDGEPLITFAAATGNSSESVGASNIVVILSNNSIEQVTVAYNATDTTAVGSGTDYTLSAGTLTFNAGENTKTISVSFNNDTIDEPSETFDITLGAAVNGTVSAPGIHTHTINDDDATPVVNFASSTDSTNEEDPSLGTIELTLSNASSNQITVNYSVAGVSATSGVDYTLASGVLTIPALATSYTLQPDMIGDAISEGPETFTVTITGTNASASLGTTTIHTHTINDDESAPTVYFAAPTSSAAESVGSQNVVLNMSGAAGAQVEVTLLVSGSATEGNLPDDFTLSASTVTFGVGEISKTITINVNNDSVGESDETVVLDIDVVTGAGAAEGAPGMHTFTINAEDAPLVQFQAASSVQLEDNVTKNILISMSNEADSDVIVNYTILGTSTASVSDYTLSNGAITIGAGFLTGTLAVPVIDDTVFEPAPDEFINLQLNSTSANASLDTGVNHTLTIDEDETHGPATQLVYTLQPADTVAGEDILVTIEIIDAGGNLVSTGPDATANVTLTLSSGTGLLTGTVTRAAVGGVVNFGAGDNVAIDLVGSNVLRASKADMSVGGGSGALTIDSNSFNITHGPATYFVILNPTDGVVGTPITVTVRAVDNFNNIATSYSTGVTLVTSGSATGGGLVTIAAGVGTININNTVPETVNLSLSDSQVTGLDVSSTQDVVFAPTFTISGITGAGDSTQNNILGGSGSTPILTWSVYAAASSYDATIYESDGSTVKCTTVNTASTSVDFSSCNLTAGNTYVAKVKGKDSGGNPLSDAMNSPYTFKVNVLPNVVANGPWYVLSGSSIVIDAQYAAAPTVGTAQDSDVSDTLTFTAVGTTTSGVATVTNSSTSVTYNANTFIGQDSFSFTISDSSGGTVSGTITVNSVVAFTWTGMGVDSNWSTLGNWCGTINANKTGCNAPGSAPTGTNTVTFAGDVCGANCTADINVNVNVKGIKQLSTYTGTITQTSTNTITLGTDGWTHAGGAFVGGSGAITFGGPMNLSGGTFTASSGNMTLNSGTPRWVTTNSPTFNHNGGTVSFGGATAYTVSTGSIAFNNIVFTHTSSVATITGTMNVDGNLTLNSFGKEDGGEIAVKGNVSVTNNSGGTTIVSLIGNSNQTITGTSGEYLPGLKINSTGGTVSLVGTVGVNGNFNYMAGNIDPGVSTVDFSKGSGIQTIDYPSNLTLYNVRFSGYEDGAQTTISNAPVLTVNDLEFIDAGGPGSFALNQGVIDVNGSIYVNKPKMTGGTTLIRVIGSNSQSVSSFAGALTTFQVSKSGGILTFTEPVTKFGRAFTYNSGSVDASATRVVFVPAAAVVITPGSVNFNDVEFASGGSTITLSGTMFVNNDLYLSAAATGTTYMLNSGVIAVKGDATLNHTRFNGGTTSIKFDGTGDQIISRSAGVWPSGTFIVDKSSGRVIQNSAINLAVTGQDLNILSGVWDMAGFALTLHDGIDNDSNILNVGDGIGVAGTAALYKGCGSLSAEYDFANTDGVIYNGTYGSTISIANATNVAEGTTQQFVVTVSPASCLDTKFNYSTLAGTATAGSDYTSITPTTGTITHPSTSMTISVATSNDSIHEVDESYSINLTSASPSSLPITTASATGTITSEDLVPAVSFASASSSTVENNTNIYVVVNLSRASSQSFTVDYQLRSAGLGGGGTATNITDYSYIHTGAIGFNAGETSKSFMVSIVEDTSNEADETIIFEIFNATGGLTWGADTQHTITIIEDDFPTLAVADLSVDEGSPAQFVVSLSASSDRTIAFDYATADGTATSGSDFTSASGTGFVIPSGQNSVTLPNITVASADGTDAGEIFYMNISNATNIAGAGNDLQGEATITENTVNNIAVSNLVISNITMSGFNASVDFTGDPNANGALTLYWCNETDNSSCDPQTVNGLAQGSVVMARGATSYTASVTGLSSPNDPGDSLNVRVVAVDTDGVSGSPIDTSVQLPMKKIYRSVGPGSYAQLANGSFAGPNNLTINGGYAYFQNTLPNRIGVGDVIQYDNNGDATIDAIMFISGRVSGTQYRVQTATGAEVANMATGDTDWSINRAYTSLNFALSMYENTSIWAALRDFDDINTVRNLVANATQWNIALYDDSDDFSQKVLISNWQTSPAAYLKIYTPFLSTEVGVSQRHSGFWSDQYGYALIVNGNTALEVGDVDHIQIEGLKIEANSLPTNKDAIVIGNSTMSGSAVVKLSHLFVHAGVQDNYSGPNSDLKMNPKVSGIHIYPSIPSTAKVQIWNIGAVIEAPEHGRCVDIEGGDVTLYNNDFIMCGAFGVFASSPATVLAKNNIIIDALIGGFYGTGAITESSNLVNNLSVAMFNPSEGDFRLRDTDTVAKGNGADLSADAVLPFNDDMSGFIRSTPWDIGASKALPGPTASQLAIVGPKNLRTNRCEYVYVQLHDQYGNLLIPTSNISFTLNDGSPNGDFYLSSNDCVGNINSQSGGTLNNGSREAVFYYKNNTAGLYSLSAIEAPDTLSNPVMSLNIYNATAHHWEVEIPEHILSDTCVEGKVLWKDQYNNSFSDWGITTSIDKLYGNPSVNFYTTSSCTTPEGSPLNVTFVVGESEKSFWFKPHTLTGSLTLRAFGGGYYEGYGSAVSYAPAQQKLDLFVAQNIAKDSCVKATVSRTDEFGQPRSDGVVSVDINKLSGSPSVYFYTSSACTGTSTSLTLSLANGQTSKDFWVKPFNLDGLVTLQATATSFESDTLVSSVYTAAGYAWELEVAQYIPNSTCVKATVHWVDQFNNPFSSASTPGVTISKVSGAPTVEFFATSNCTGSLGSIALSLASGSSSKDFWLKPSGIGWADLLASDGGTYYDGNTSIESYTPGAGRWDLDLADNIAAGVCLKATVTRFDHKGNLFYGSAQNVEINKQSAGSPNIDFYNGENCTNPAGGTLTLSLALGQASHEFWYKTNSGTGSLTVRASHWSGGYSPDDEISNVYNPAPHHLQLVLPVSAGIGLCVKGTVSRYDDFNNLFTGVEQNINLNGVSGPAVNFYMSSDCTAMQSVLSFAPDEGAKDFWFKVGSGSGDLTISATHGSYQTGTEIVNIYNAIPGNLELVIPEFLALNSCVKATVSRYDTNNNPYINVSHIVNLNQISGSPNADFFATSSCAGLPVTSVELLIGESSKDIWVRATNTSGAMTLRASHGSYANGDALTTVYNPTGSGGEWHIEMPAQIANNNCVKATVSRLDQYGNLHFGSAQTVSISKFSGSAPIDFFYSSSCTGPQATLSLNLDNNQATKDFWLRAYAPVDTSTIRASTAPYADGDINVTNYSSPTLQSWVFALSENVLLDSCVKVTVSRLDQYGYVYTDAASNIDINKGSGAPDLSFYMDSSCTSPYGATPINLSMNVGQQTRDLWFKPVTSTGYVSLRGLNGATVVREEWINVYTASSQHWVLDIPAALPKDSCVSASLSRKDQFNNLYTGAATSASLFNDSGATVSFYDSANCTGDATVDFSSGVSTKEIWVQTSSSLGGFVARASGGSASDGTQSALVYNPLTSHWALSLPTHIPPNNCIEVAVSRHDQYDQDYSVGSASVTITLDSGTPSVSIYDSPNCGAGDNVIEFVSGISQKSFWMYVTGSGSMAIKAEGLPFQMTIESAFVYTPAPHHWEVELPDVIASNACVQGKVWLKDAYNNPVTTNASPNVNLTYINGGSPWTSFYDSSSCTTTQSNYTFASNDTFKTIWVKPSGSGTLQVQASGAGFVNGDLPVTVYTPSTYHWELETAPGAVTGACVKVTISRKDQMNGYYAGPVQGVDIEAVSGSPSHEFHSTETCSYAQATLNLSFAAGEISKDIWVKALATGDLNMRAFSASGYADGIGVIDIYTPVAHHWELELPEAVAQNDCVKATVWLKDEYNNPVASGSSPTVNINKLNSGNPGVSFYYSSACSTPQTSLNIGFASNEISKEFWVRPTTGTGELIVSAQGGSFLDDISGLTAYAPVAHHLEIETQDHIVNGQCAKATVWQKDQYGQPFITGGNTNVDVDKVSGSPAISFYTAAGCGGGSSGPPLNLTITAGNTENDFWFQPTTSGDFTLRANASGFGSGDRAAISYSPVPGSWRLVAPQTHMLTNDCVRVEVQRLDQYGYPHPNSASYSEITIGTAGQALSVHSNTDTTCSMTSNNTVTVPMNEFSNWFHVKLGGSTGQLDIATYYSNGASYNNTSRSFGVDFVNGAENRTGLSQFLISDISSGGFTANANKEGDSNSNATLEIYYCNDTKQPNCDPMTGSQSTLNPSIGNTYSSTIGVTNPAYDPNDFVRIRLVAADADGVVASYQEKRFQLQNAACLGASVAGACWTPSNMGASCEQACSSSPGSIYDDFSTRFLAGSDAPDVNNCTTILNMFFGVGSVSNVSNYNGAGQGLGCFEDGGSFYRETMISTDAMAFYPPNAQRACACKAVQ